MILNEYIYPGSVNIIKKALSDLKATNILLVRGKQSYAKSGAEAALNNILKSFKVIEFNDFSVNPKLEEAKIGYDLFNDNDVDVIIAVGGGSVIDTAKIIKSLAIKSDLKNTTISLIAIPTTAGTGTEATHFAVVYIDGIKHSWADKTLIPTVAIVDANLLAGQTNYQMAVSGFDAFAQAVESLWSVNATEESQVYSEKAISLLWLNLKKAVNGDVSVFENVALGSNLAGKAINIAKTTAPHALSYHITSEFSLPHGHAVALFLPYFITYNFYLNKNSSEHNTESIKTTELLNKLTTILGVDDSSLLEAEVNKFISEIGIETNFNKLGISKEDIIITLKSANPERLQNNPRVFNNREFIEETLILSI